MSLPELPGVLAASDIAATAHSISQAQEESGAIPWFPGGDTDPWDHVEAAMALDVGGLHAQAAAAYRWLSRAQRRNGSWAARYRLGAVTDPMTESNHCGYIAVGCWHHWLATGDDEFLDELWPTVCRALDFVLGMQSGSGAVWWACTPDGVPDRMALLTGCSSIHHALACGLAIARRLGVVQPDWELALGRLRHALLHHPLDFVDKSGYSMDWYYPVLGGAVRDPAAAHRLAEGWHRFVVPGLGVRCVADRPWVTGAETCELALALAGTGRAELARDMVTAMQHLRHGDGSYWTGLVVDDRQRWPVERSTWTAAAVLLAVDAVDGRQPRSRIFDPAHLPAGVEIGAACGMDLLCGKRRPDGCWH